MKQTICPKCFAICSAEETAYICTTPGCPKLHVPLLAKDAPVSAGSPACPACGKSLTSRVCRICGYEFNEEEMTSSTDTLPISIVGAEGSGKSNYLSVLVDSIKNEMGKIYNCALYPLGGDVTINLYEKLYYNPLFVQGKCIESTSQDTLSPLVYSLVFAGENRSGRTCNITFYDACGSNFEDVKLMNDFNRSIYNSRVILFLIDPAQFPDLREHLKSPGRQVATLDASTVLSRTIHLIRNGKGFKNLSQKINIPIAICLTKIDTVMRLLDPSSFVHYPTRHFRQAKLDHIDYESVDAEMRSLIESWAGKEFINLVESQFETFSFFGFSSLGASPNPNNQIHRLAPHRVIDPFLWALWINKIIAATS